LGLPTTREDLRKYSVKLIVDSYLYARQITDEDEEDFLEKDLKELSQKAGFAYNVFITLHQFASHPKYSSMTLFEFNARRAEECRDEMLKETWKPPGSHKAPQLFPSPWLCLKEAPPLLTKRTSVFAAPRQVPGLIVQPKDGHGSSRVARDFGIKYHAGAQLAILRASRDASRN
jgi:hypothetical protein